jgi:hypothetical protein
VTFVYLASGTGLRSWDSLCNDFSDVNVNALRGREKCILLMYD